MAPTPEERGVADRGTSTRGEVLRAGRPPGYATLTHASQLVNHETGIRMTFSIMEGKRLIALARAKNEFLIHQIDELQGTPEEIARAESDLAESLLQMRAEFDRRLKDPKLYDEYVKLGWGSADAPFAGVTDSADPFMHYRLWQSLLLPERKPKRRKRKKKEFVLPSYLRGPLPKPEPPSDEEFKRDFAQALRTVPNFGRRRPEQEIDRYKEQLDALEQDGTDIFDRIAFVSDGTSVAIELLELGFGAQVFATGFAAVSLIGGTLFMLGQSSQKSAQTAQRNGFRLTSKQYLKQLKEKRGKGVRVSVSRALRDVRKYDWESYHDALYVPNLSQGRYKEYYEKGAREAAQVVNNIADIADQTTRTQVNLSKLRFKYKRARIAKHFIDVAHRRRIKFYVAFLRKAKIIR